MPDPNYGGMAQQMLQLAQRRPPGSAAGRDPGQPPYQGLDRAMPSRPGLMPGINPQPAQPPANSYMPQLRGRQPAPGQTQGLMRMEPSFASPSQLGRLA